ncbi:hypothetical protein B0H66DRAFT_135970 [Apodospora peruviana]|uniref:Uncharacterized protein n=1 Tax=Apodospora peruviana TaxID=516989 RepID=A0AAE0MAU8_9PEZI|nr:hypothetical protein B0H66DRAFT_135970 [Apodospora peruviana]
MSFVQDPRLRQRWNQISHNAEAVTENAAAGIWTFQHRYINPCLASFGQAIDSCTGVCIGDREERARRARERERGARPTRAEYTFDFYDDWEDADDEGAGTGGLLGSWGGGRGEDWDRLLAGTGNSRSKHAGGGSGDVVDQPRRKRGMSYGTRGVRRKASGEEDPNVIPRTAPLGFLGRLPFKIGGTLRYKPSAANLRDHPGAPVPEHGEANEHEPLLGTSDDDDGAHHGQQKRSPQSRARSNTTGSGETSSSYRSRGDLFPSDGEGDEDAVPLDDEFAVALDRVDDRSSNKTRSSKGKRRADMSMSRTVSRTTMNSTLSSESANGGVVGSSVNPAAVSFPSLADDDVAATPSLEDLRREEEQAEREELDEIERRRRVASQLALQRGLSKDDLVDEVAATTTIYDEPKDEMEDSLPPLPPQDERSVSMLASTTQLSDTQVEDHLQAREVKEPKPPPSIDGPKDQPGFVPARLPFFR